MTNVVTPSPEAEGAGGRVVFGVDGSASSDHALRWAHFLARTLQTDLEAVTVWQSPATWAAAGWTAIPPDSWNPAADATRILESAIDRVLGESHRSRILVSVEEGSAARVLLDATQGAQALVVGSRGHGGFAGLLLGSVSAACAEHAKCPVLVVHGDTPPPGAAL